MLLGLLRPFLFLALWVCVVYWIMRAVCNWLPDGKVKTFLFKRRGWNGDEGRPRE